MHRKAFEASAKKRTKEEKPYGARTDGYLSDENRERVRALIEVKAVARASRTLEIFMQESAQMAAWILEHPKELPEPIGQYVYGDHCFFRKLPRIKANTAKSRLQVLQDRNKMYLNFARYGSKYLSYLTGKGGI